MSDLSPNAQSVLQFVTRTEDGQELVTAALKEAISITPDPRMNALVVSGPVDYMGLLEQIVGRLDNSSSREAKIRVFSLRNADAQQTAQLLLSMFRMQPTGAAAAGTGQRTIQYTLMKPAADGTETPSATAVIGSEEQTALSVSVDPRTNTLLVGGTEHYVALVQQIIETLDSSEALERKTEVYRLKMLRPPMSAPPSAAFSTKNANESPRCSAPTPSAPPSDSSNAKSPSCPSRSATPYCCPPVPGISSRSIRSSKSWTKPNPKC